MMSKTRLSLRVECLWPPPAQTARIALAAALIALVMGSPTATAQSSLGDGGLSGALGAWKGFIERQKQNEQAQEPAVPDDPAYDSTNSYDSDGAAKSHGYYPDAGAGSTKDQIRRSQGAYGSVYGEGQALNCGPGCKPEGNICTCADPGDVGGPRTSPGNALSPYEGGGVTAGDVVGEPGWDGNSGLPGGN